MSKKNNHKTVPNDRKGLQVVENPLINKFLSSSLPEELHSDLYKYQAFLGVLGILLIFFSFRIPLLFFAGAVLLFIRRHWRKKTDTAAVNYRNAITALKRKKYLECVGHLDQLPLGHPSLHYLTLVKASCYLELENPDAAYLLYSDYFGKTPASAWLEPIYDSALENATVLAIENNNTAMAKKILETTAGPDEETKKESRWKEELRHLIR